jgi:hypothetical protein
MIILSTVSFPPESAKEIGKRFTELAPLPDYITRRGPYILPVTGQASTALASMKLTDLPEWPKQWSFSPTNRQSTSAFPGIRTQSM